jgi:hypothetical protein
MIDLAPAPGPPPADLPFALLLGRLEAGARAAVGPFAEATAGRHARDHARIEDYHAALAAELRGARRKVTPELLASKLEQIVAERDAKLRALSSRFALRLSLHLAAGLCVVAPAATARLRVRRRKDARELSLALPAGAAELDALVCDGCRGPSRSPALCDDRLHVLCDRCAPSAQGRIRCPACERGARGRPA